MITTTCPACWNSARRSRTYANPRWISGDVASMPSFTRNGRSSFSFRSSSSFGSTSTALRVRSAAVIAGSLVSGCLEIRDLHRLELVSRFEPEKLTRERQECLQRTPDRVSAAKAVTFPLERDVRIRNPVPFECRDDHFRLRRRHDLVVESLEQEQRTGDLVRMRDRRALPVEILL